MSRKLVGYFEGTDSTLLTHLICAGCDTLPISNGYDNHGRHVRLINEDSKPDLMIGYLHKIYALEDAETRYQDIFHICRIYRVPFLVVVPSQLHERAGQLLVDIPETVQLVDPSAAVDAALAILKR